MPKLSAAKMRSPTRTSEIGIDSPDSKVTDSDPAKQEDPALPPPYPSDEDEPMGAIVGILEDFKGDIDGDIDGVSATTD